MDLFIQIQREAYSTDSVGHRRGQVWHELWQLVFMGWVTSYANEMEGYSNYLGQGWSFPGIGKDHSLVFWQCFGTVMVSLGVSFNLQVEDQGLVEVCLPSILTHLNQFMLCPWAMASFQKLCPAPFPPVSCSFPEPCLGPQCCLYNLVVGQPENSWPLGGKYCIISNPSIGFHLPCFLKHAQKQHISVDQLWRVTGTNTCQKSTCWSHPSNWQLIFLLWDLAPQAIWAQSLTT